MIFIYVLTACIFQTLIYEQLAVMRMRVFSGSLKHCF
jgi:hypothetical protein